MVIGILRVLCEASSSDELLSDVLMSDTIIPGILASLLWSGLEAHVCIVVSYSIMAQCCRCYVYDVHR